MIWYISSPITRSGLVYAGWFLLPNSVTNIVFVCYIRLRLRFNPQYRPPARSTPSAAALYRYCYGFTMITYLLVTTAHSLVTMPSSFYDILGVDSDADEQALKAAFRHFARRNHPDRVGSSGEAFFIAVRDAYESLKDPLRRFAYDRFGPSAMTWKNCATHKECIKHGLLASSGYYIGTITLLTIWSIFGVNNTGAYWRNLLLCALFFSELCLVLSTYSDATDFPQRFRPRVPYQYITFLHQLYMSLSIAIARVIPVLLPTPAETSAQTLALAKPLIDKLAILTMTTDQEVSKLLSLEVRSMQGSSAVPPFTTDAFALSPNPLIASERTIQELTNEMENLIIDRELRSNPVLRTQWQAVVDRLQQDAEPTSPVSVFGETPQSTTSIECTFPLKQSIKEEEDGEKTFD